MSNGKNQRSRGNNQQQQRRRRGGPGGGGRQQQQAPKGPAMTALGESTYEAVFDHGNEGYGVWFDGVVREDPNYKQFWKGTGMRPIFVKIDEDRIVITKELDRDLPRLGSDSGSARDDEDSQDDSGEMVYSPEEAAALFAADDATNGAVAEAEAATEAAAADDDEGEPEAEAEEAPAPKRRTTRRRTTKPADDEG